MLIYKPEVDDKGKYGFIFYLEREDDYDLGSKTLLVISEEGENVKLNLGFDYEDIILGN